MTDLNYDSPARKHKQSVLAKKSMVDNTHGEVSGSAYELLCLKLTEDKRALKALQSIKAKIELKATLLPHYDDWVNATLEHGTGKSDKLLATVMLWHIDVGNFARGIDIAEYMLSHGMKMPDTHQRTTATVVAEEVADTTKRLISEGALLDEQAIAQVLRASTVTTEHDMPDQVRAKLAKIIGELTEPYDPENALANYKQALAYDPKAKVKTAIKRVEKAIANQQNDTPDNPDASSEGNATDGADGLQADSTDEVTANDDTAKS